jgi:hypothetical protein
MKLVLSPAKLAAIPVDFLADPDGDWNFETLARRSGFDERWGEVAVGALKEPFAGFPEGAAVVAFTSGNQCSVAIVDCTTPEGSEVSLESSELHTRSIAA